MLHRSRHIDSAGAVHGPILLTEIAAYLEIEGVTDPAFRSDLRHYIGVLDAAYIERLARPSDAQPQ